MFTSTNATQPGVVPVTISIDAVANGGALLTVDGNAITLSNVDVQALAQYLETLSPKIPEDVAPTLG